MKASRCRTSAAFGDGGEAQAETAVAEEKRAAVVRPVLATVEAKSKVRFLTSLVEVGQHQLLPCRRREAQVGNRASKCQTSAAFGDGGEG